MKAGDIIFVHGDDAVDKLIEYFDHGQFSHVAIAISDTEIVEAQYKINVVKRTFPKEYVKYSIIDLGLTNEERNKVPSVALKLLDKKYDYLQILGCLIEDVFNIKGPNLLNNHQKLICSELVFTVLNETNILKDLNINVDDGIDLTPNQLYDLLKYIGIEYKHNIT